jgi:hypothetical protein
MQPRSSPERVLPHPHCIISSREKVPSTPSSCTGVVEASHTSSRSDQRPRHYLEAATREILRFPNSGGTNRTPASSRLAPRDSLSSPQRQWCRGTRNMSHLSTQVSDNSLTLTHSQDVGRPWVAFAIVSHHTGQLIPYSCRLCRNSRCQYDLHNVLQDARFGSTSYSMLRVDAPSRLPPAQPLVPMCLVEHAMSAQPGFRDFRVPRQNLHPHPMPSAS